MSYSQYFGGSFEGLLPSACLADTTPPTFAGVSASVAQPNGSVLVSWAAGTDTTPPIRYEVYVQASSPTGLFSLSNISQISTGTSAYVYTLNDTSRLQKNVTYYFGVRAVDAVGNRNTNTTSTSAVSTGVLDDDMATIAASLAATELLLAADHVNFQSDHANFQSDISALNSLSESRYAPRGVVAINNANELVIDFWLTRNEEVITSLLGAGKFTVYDSVDVTVPGLTQSGISANGNGTYIATPISASALDAFTTYKIKFEIVHDGNTYISYRGLTVWE